MAKQTYIPVAEHLGKKVIITLKRSLICTVPKQRAYCQTLCLKTVGDTRECEYTPQIHGMVKLMPHLVSVTAVDLTVKG